MKPDSELIEALRAVLPEDGRTFRISIRHGRDSILSCETDAPIRDISSQESPPESECRVEVQGAGGRYSTLVPWFRLGAGTPDERLVLNGPRDPHGMPVRLTIHDDAIRAYTVDFAGFGGSFVLDAATLPKEHLLRAKYLHWSSETGRWNPVGLPHRITGTGKLRRPEVSPRHFESARRLLRRLEELFPTEERQTTRLLEFYDEAEFLSDVAADADDAELIDALAELAAGASEVSLRVRSVTFREDGSKVLGPLKSLLDLKSPFDALARFVRRSGEGATATMKLLDLTVRDDSKALKSLVSTTLFHIVPEGLCVDPRSWKPDAVESLCEAWDAREGASFLIGETVNYLALYAALHREATARGRMADSFFSREHLHDCIEPLLEKIDSLPPTRRTFHTTLMFQAKLESLRDRERAHELFIEALASDSPMTGALAFDRGAETYFSTSHIGEVWPVVAERRRDLMRALRVVSRPEPGLPQPLFLFSCDPRFMAIYLPHWLSMAEYCKARGIDFHFVVIGDPEAAAAAIESVEPLRVALAGLRGAVAGTYADNVTYSIWSTPAWCAEPVTFYACARYLALGALTKMLDRHILVQDIDFNLVEDPANFMSRFPLPGFGIQGSSALYGFDPWRRFMAGTFYAPNTDEARESLKSVEAYLVEGLAVGGSWCLDQNALSFFFEQACEAGEALCSLKVERPTRQHKVNRMIEAAQATPKPPTRPPAASA